MSDKTFSSLLLVSVVGLAALLLWMRDRFRDLRHVPEEVRKISEQKNASGATALAFFMYGALCIYRIQEEPVFIPGIYYAVGAALFAFGFVKSLARYRKLGVPRDARQSGQ